MLLPQWFFLLFRNVRGLETKSQKEIIARHDSYFSVHRGFYFRSAGLTHAAEIRTVRERAADRVRDVRADES